MASRSNSLTHGLTATVLTLPDENPDHVKTEADAWRDTYQPENHDEEVLVGHLALATVRLERLAKAEDAVVDEQVRRAEVIWDFTQQNNVLRATAIFFLDPAKAVVELKSFGAGVAWLLARWIELAQVFNVHDSWLEIGPIKQALRFLGHEPLRLDQEPYEAEDFAAAAFSCVKDPALAVELAKALGFVLPDNWRTRYLIPDAVRAIRQRIDDEIDSLAALDTLFKTIDTASRAEAATRAMVPIDSPQTRLTLRYRKAAETSFDRSLRALQKLQSDRQKAIEMEAKEAQEVDLPNEATVVGTTRSKRIHVGSCVTIHKVKYEVLETSDGNLVLCPWVEAPEPTVLGVGPAPETGV
jgi:hypothetical protein